jgi:hypothetical protein
MESRPDLKLQRILDNVRHHFDFLSRRGFRIVSVIFADPDYENWQIIMLADDCLIKIYSYMGKVSVALSTRQLYNEVGLFELTDLIYLITGDESLSESSEESPINETQRFEEIAGLLEKYLDEVLREIGEIPILPPSDNPSKTSLNEPGQLSEDNCPGSLF